MRNEETILAVEHLDAGYSGESVVRDILFVLKKGEILGLTGPNGAGKSTIVNAVSGLIRPSNGRILLQGNDVAGYHPRDLINRGVSALHQGDTTFEDLTVEENLAVAVSPLRLKRREFRRRLDEVATLFPILAPKMTDLVRHLSGGQQQITALASAFIRKPACLLLDEPTTGLAANVIEEFKKTLTTVASSGTAILLVEQNLNVLFDLAPRVMLLHAGRIRSYGTAAEIAAEPNFRAKSC